MIRMLTLTARLRWVAAIVALAILGGASTVAFARSGDLPEDAAFRVDDRTVSTDDLAERVDVLEALYGVKKPDDDEGGFDRAAAKSMAVSLILEDEARSRDITIADKAAQDQLDDLIDDQLAGGRKAFDEFLTTAGINEQDVLDEIKRQLATSRLVEEITTDVPSVGDDDVRQHFDKNIDKMVTRETRRIGNIVVATRADAGKVAKLARAGSSFTTLAKTYSRDASTADKAGDLGWLAAPQLDLDFAEAAFGAAGQAVFGPVQTQYGWNVGKVRGIRKPVPLKYDEVKEQIREELGNKARLDVWRSYLGKLLKDVDVEYADAYRPEDPDAPPADLPSTSG
jgi:peptidyl-prolyl cis-trans isomerase C